MAVRRCHTPTITTSVNSTKSRSHELRELPLTVKQRAVGAQRLTCLQGGGLGFTLYLRFKDTIQRYKGSDTLYPSVPPEMSELCSQGTALTSWTLSSRPGPGAK